jgi:SAM-dependent methyltransferase
MTPPRPFYGVELANIHHTGFSAYAGAFAPELVALLRASGIRRGQVVELGCGGGLTAGRLMQAGYEVFGIDGSREMIRLARANVPGGRFRVARAERARLPTCAAVVTFGEVLSYANGLPPGGPARTARDHRQMLGGLFARIASALQPDGLLVFDFMESGVQRTHARRIVSGEGWRVTTRATLDRSGRLLTRDIRAVRRPGGAIRRSREIHRVCIHTRADIRQLLRDAGFQVTFRRRLGGLRVATGDVLAVCRKRRESSRASAKAAPRPLRRQVAKR